MWCNDHFIELFLTKRTQVIRTAQRNLAELLAILKDRGFSDRKVVYMISFTVTWSSFNVAPLKKVLHTLCSLASKPCAQSLHAAHKASRLVHSREICYPPEYNKNFSVSCDFSPRNPTGRLYFFFRKKNIYIFSKRLFTVVRHSTIW